jgi:hypothetical protein
MKSEKRKPQREFRWYKAIVPGAHLPHPGTREHYTYYVWATDAMFAYEKLYKLPGWKRDLGKNHAFPTIRAIDAEETKVIEELIEKAPNVTIEQAKKAGYYYTLNNNVTA